MAKGSPQFVLKPMILHKWVPILLGFLVGFPGKKNPRKTTEGVSSSHQVSPSSFSQSKEVQKWCEGFHKSTMEISKSFGRPFFCGSNLPDFHKKNNFWWFWARFWGISISLSSKQRWISGFWVLTRNLILAPITEAFWGGGVEVWCYVNNSTLPRLRATVL